MCTSSRITFSERQAGPRVTIIFVLRILDDTLSFAINCLAKSRTSFETRFLTSSEDECRISFDGILWAGLARTRRFVGETHTDPENIPGRSHFPQRAFVANSNACSIIRFFRLSVNHEAKFSCHSREF